MSGAQRKFVPHSFIHLYIPRGGDLCHWNVLEFLSYFEINNHGSPCGG